MVQIAGKYQNVENHKFKEILVKWGIPEDKAQEINNAKTVLEITVDGKKITLKNDEHGGNHICQLTLDAESEDKYENNVVKNLATLNGNVLKVESKTENGTPTASRTYTFNDSGLEIVYNTTDNFTARCVYKRL